ncbi:MAG: PPC domain-containing DNA-binding protein [Myxococcales bacterium]|jgi:predicted DNA-binding protein with PD1-like motif
MASHHSNETSRAVPAKVVVLRIEPGADLKESLDELARRHAIEAGVVITCVGSLSRAVIRLATGTTTRTLRRKLEIVSLVGTLSARGGSHLHVSLADTRGAVVGGHVKPGCIVFTTAEVAVGMLAGVQFEREQDERTGYRELVVRRGRKAPRA